MNISNLFDDCFFIIFDKLHLSEINNLLRTSKQFVNRKNIFGKYINKHYPKRRKLEDFFVRGMNGVQTHLMDNAFKLGHLPVVKYLHEEKGIKFSPDVMFHAVMNNHLKLIKYLRKNKYYYCPLEMINHAGQYGHFYIIKYFYELHKNQKVSWLLEETLLACENIMSSGYYFDRKILDDFYLEAKPPEKIYDEGELEQILISDYSDSPSL